MAQSAEHAAPNVVGETGRIWLDELLPALRRLDRLLGSAMEGVQQSYVADTSVENYRGLYISPELAASLLSREPATAAFQVAKEPGSAAEQGSDTSRLGWLQRAFGLSPFDLDLLIIALAPELDLRYERLYAFLQDDVTRRRPTVDLSLNLLCPDTESRVLRRAHLAVEAPLLRYGLLQLLNDPHQPTPPLLAQSFKLDDQIVRWLLGQRGLDARLAPFCEIVPALDAPTPFSTPAGPAQALPALARRSRLLGRPLHLYFHGPRGVGKRKAAEALGADQGTPLLIVDLRGAPAIGAEVDRLFSLVFREALLQDMVLYLQTWEALAGSDRVMHRQQLLRAIADHPGLVILAGEQPWQPRGDEAVGMLIVEFPVPPFLERRAVWQSALATVDISLPDSELETLAGRFRLTPAQVEDAVATAIGHARWRASAEESAPVPEHPNLEDFFAAARAQAGHDLAALARKITPINDWNDIVLPADALAQLREMCQQVVHRQRVLTDWGFERKLALGKGVNALFAGPPGTGKTLAAEIIASHLGLDLYEVDLSRVVSKYIGETEENLERIFRAAESANAILLFNEADALFGPRSQVHDSHDRYANVEVAYLLQRMESYEGISILTTNLRHNMDQAFIRRLQFIVEFPFPDEDQREQIWRHLFPASAPLGPDIDYRFLARQFRISGGGIKNIVLGAAFLATADGHIRMQHLIHATRREHQKMGKPLSSADLGPYSELEVIE